MTEPIEQSIRTHLITHPEVFALVGDRVYPGYKHQGVESPCILYQRVSTERALTHDQKPSGLTTARIQFDVLSDTLDQALTIADVMRIALVGYRGDLGENYAQIILPALEMHGDREETTARVIIDYSISFTEE